MAVLAINFTAAQRSRFATVLCIVHMLCAGCGIAFFGLGIYIKIRLLTWLKLIDGYNDNLLPVMMAVVGTLLVVIDVAGAKLVSSAESSSRVRYLLIPYLAIIFILSLCILGAGSICFVHQRHLSKAFHRGLTHAMQRYKDNSTLKTQIDLVQMKFECCGNLRYEDWFDIQWINNRYIDLTDAEVQSKMTDNGMYLNDDVPFSCCDANVTRHCIHHHVHDNDMHFNYNYQTDLTIYTDGCKKKLMSYYRFRLGNVGAIVMSMFVMQIFMLIGVRYLQTAVHNSTKDPEGDSRGYLYDKSEGEVIKKQVGKAKKQVGKAKKQVGKAKVKGKTKDRDVEAGDDDTGEESGSAPASENEHPESDAVDSFDSDHFDSPEENAVGAPDAAEEDGDDGSDDAQAEKEEEPVYANLPFHQEKTEMLAKIKEIPDDKKESNSKKETSKSKASKKVRTKSSKKDSTKSSKKSTKKEKQKSVKESPANKKVKSGSRKSPRSTRKSKMKNKNNNIIGSFTELEGSKSETEYSRDFDSSTDDLRRPLLDRFYSSSEEEELLQRRSKMAARTMAARGFEGHPKSEEEIIWLTSRTEFSPPLSSRRKNKLLKL